MRIAPPYAAAGALIAGLFVVRAAVAVPAARAYELGREAASRASYDDAGPLLERAAIGGDLTGTLWRAGQAWIQAWYRLPETDQFGRAGDEAIRAATVCFLTARAASPASAWFLGALSDVYGLRFRTDSARRNVDLGALERGPWALVGDDGRIAIGLARAAITREPNRFDHRDRLVLLLETVGLHDEALRAIEDSARVLPDFDAHPDLEFDDLSTDLVERFWQTARALGPDDAPALSRERRLLAAGQLARRLGRLPEAEHDLRAALNEPGTGLSKAEEAFHLALVLVDLKRFDEAEALLGRAVREPVFGPGVATTRARIAKLQERWSDALAQLREARRLQPRELWVLLEFARVAQKTGEWDQADEAIRWAILVHPESPAPRSALVEMFLAQGESTRARGALDEYTALFGRSEDVARLERALAPLDQAGR